ncbi:MAG: phosphate ABC transporter permease PstA [Rhodospirillaceae bacterium]|nr:phosphate ABC transporter permease PstA [Rhodospirillaceae bacterium]
MNDASTIAVPAAQTRAPAQRMSDLRARGEPFTWALGGALALGCIMIAGFLLMVFWNGAITFVPKPLAVVTLTDGTVTAGEPTRTELYRPTAETIAKLPPSLQQTIRDNDGYASRTLFRIGNYDIYNEDFRWVSDFEIAKTETPANLLFAERVEWGPLVATLKSIVIDGQLIDLADVRDARFAQAHADARAKRARLAAIEKHDIGKINHEIEQLRLSVRKVELDQGRDSPAFAAAQMELEARSRVLQDDYKRLADELATLRAANDRQTATFAEIGGREKVMTLDAIVRIYPANDIDFLDKAGIYLSRWWEFISDEPREANTEGGILPAIFGTAAMTLLMVIAVAPFGVITALYLREYAKQGRLVSIVRISVNNLAGVPSIVYGVFGLGFFAYVLGGTIDQLLYAERLPNPTFGTGGLLWASLTLALLTVPVVIVATEEALAAVPRSMREGSLACGASKWQTIKYIVLPRALPGIMTGIILAMARGAGEVAPLMLVGVVKLAPELPIDGNFPFVHLERSFMHLGFHIFDVGFQSRNSEAGKPMVFVTTMLLIGLIFAMNLTAIIVRNRLKRKFVGSQF